MSQENVELVGDHFGAMTRVLNRYWERPRSFAAAVEADELDADERKVLDGLHPDMRWTNVLGIVYEGKVACARGVDELLEAAQAYSVRLDEVVGLDRDRVLTIVRSAMRGESSGAPGTVLLFTVVTVRDGLIARAQEYLSRDEALQAVGLKE